MMRYLITLIIILLSIAGYSQMNGGAGNNNGQTVNTTLTADTVDCLKAKIDTLDYTPPHAYIRFADSSTTLSLTQNNYANITNAWDSLYRKLEFVGMSYSGDSLILQVAGDYVLHFQLSFQDGGNDDYEVVVNHEGTIISKGAISTQAAADDYTITIPAYIYDAAVDDRVYFQMRNTADNDDATVITSIIFIYLLH